jgi:hypothetical protein
MADEFKGSHWNLHSKTGKKLGKANVKDLFPPRAINPSHHDKTKELSVTSKSEQRVSISIPSSTPFPFHATFTA